jgi:peroxiredoxin
LCLLLGYHVLMHLPVLDFRAYKTGTDIEQAMQKDPNFPDVYAYDWYYTIDGKETIVTTDGVPPAGYGKYEKVETRLVQEAPEAKIHDFSITKNGEDFTQEMLDKPRVAFVLIYDMTKAESDGLDKIAAFAKRARTAGYEVIGLSANTSEQLQPLIQQHQLDLEFYVTDGTQLKTAVRSNPAVLIVEEGVIKAKSHWNDFEEMDL